MNTAPLRFAGLLAVVLAAACDKVPPPPSIVSSAVVPASRPAETTAPLAKAPAATYQRDLYGTLEDCVADWAYPAKCVPVVSAPERSRGAAFMGPIYSNAFRFEAQMATRRAAFDQGYVARLDESPSNRAIATSQVRS